MSKSSEEQKCLLVLDGTALAFRAFFAIRNLTDQQGRPSGALFGYISSILRALQDHPTSHVVVAWDLPSPTFRHKMDPEYKANREDLDEDLAVQFPWMREITELMGIPQISQKGYEADDLIASFAKQGPKNGFHVRMFSSDKDLSQVVTEEALQCPPPRKSDSETILMGPNEIEEKFGLPPEQMAEWQALVGDSSDNIKGMPGVGPKRATALLKKYGNLEDLLTSGPDEEKGKLAENLKNHADDVRHALKLVTMVTDLPLGDWDIYQMQKPDIEVLQGFCEDHSLNTLSVRLSEKFGGEEDVVKQNKNVNYVESRRYQTVDNTKDLIKLKKNLSRSKRFAFDTETTSTDAMTAKLVGMSFCYEAGHAYYVPCMGEKAPQGPDGESAVDFLKDLLVDSSIGKIGQNFKYDAHVMRENGAPTSGWCFDTMIAHSILYPLSRHNIDAMALQHFGLKKIPTKEILGTGKKAVTMDMIDVETVSEYACEDADICFQLFLQLEKEIKDKKLESLFYEIELPVAEALIDMECAGIKIDTSSLENMRIRLEDHRNKTMKKIFEMAGEEFNLNSPKQLGPILFEKLEIQKERKVRVGKTKTGYKTDAATLEKFSGLEIADLILDYRHTTKLISTYLEALPRFVNKKTQCVHSSFNQALVATGRLSSSDPNLQNIPIRTEEGKEIRSAFIPLKDDWDMVSADYSQVELRVVAHLAEDDSLQAAFKNDTDIHAHTAAAIEGLDIKDVDADMRSKAKAVNFGILYGMGPHRLGQQTGMSFMEAQDFIEQYFEAFPKVKEWLNKTLETAREKEEVKTLAGRSRPTPGVNSSDGRVRSSAENMAVNTPVQGSAADIIKIAMIRIHKRLAKENLQARMLLQVHDELIFDCPKDETNKLCNLILEEMENAYPLSVPLKVDIGTGKNWAEAH